MRCPDWVDGVDHPTHWHVVRADNIVVAQGYCVEPIYKPEENNE